VLIEKDWCSFGFKFQDRLSHGDATYENSSERSPVFLQWLDVMHLILLQFPNQFQFNETLLVFLADASTSCQFGNFLGNNEKQRKVLQPSSVPTDSLGRNTSVSRNQPRSGAIFCIIHTSFRTHYMASTPGHSGLHCQDTIADFGRDIS
jgi:hypothetical protein